MHLCIVSIQFVFKGIYNPSGLRLPLSGAWSPKYVIRLFENLYAQNMQNLLLKFDFFFKKIPLGQ